MRTFPNGDRTKNLLRPDLESGLITQHDYNLAISFFPGPRLLPVKHGIGGILLAGAYLFFVRKVPIGSMRYWPATGLGFWVGNGIGLVRTADAHKTFVSQLDEREHFFQALNNVRMRTEGKGDEIREQMVRTDVNGNTVGTGEGGAWTPSQVPTSTAAVPAPSTQEGSKPSPIPKPPSRWDEIRTANSRNGRTSSWDALRQKHERASATDNVQNTRSPESEGAQEQARFDALLDAERNYGRN
ncbi:hypothetical protein PHLGIDRAFT_130332 [Phlebiopsis gigantea 11061_1 CR5-6]|uniref:Uncharacterized protein n=1 Tax=Phlebiopsis gigantea (strain 11061_1 CR5-6) TaxID=745531 RepID=A0A0C3PD24_PHLG1|nr:hypothetical protein PHLGIDRAFT_130332 [Phlebiopsis gigantea 11061_1 CR5-6]